MYHIYVILCMSLKKIHHEDQGLKRNTSKSLYYLVGLLSSRWLVAACKAATNVWYSTTTTTYSSSSFEYTLFYVCFTCRPSTRARRGGIRRFNNNLFTISCQALLVSNSTLTSYSSLIAIECSMQQQRVHPSVAVVTCCYIVVKLLVIVASLAKLPLNIERMAAVTRHTYYALSPV